MSEGWKIDSGVSDSETAGWLLTGSVSCEPRLPCEVLTTMSRLSIHVMVMVVVCLGMDERMESVVLRSGGILSEAVAWSWMVALCRETLY